MWNMMIPYVLREPTFCLLTYCMLKRILITLSDAFAGQHFEGKGCCGECGGGGTLNTKFKMKHCLLPKQYFSLYPHYGMQPQLVSLKVEK